MQENKIWAETVLKQVRTKMEWVSEKNRDKIPYTTGSDGSYDDRSNRLVRWNHDDGLNWWTNGFWSGILWMLYQDTQDDKYLKMARVSEQKLEQCFKDFYGLHHDVGFMYLPTAVMDYRLTGNEDSGRIAMHAATLLAGRFNPIGRYIRAWNEVADADTRGWAIIDCMLNISLLYWASEESGDPRFRHIAMLHADTVMRNFVRQDGSVCHIVEYDPETGEMLRSLGGQGYGEGSSWTRGQGWALYGFANSYTHTHKREYLDTARKVAHYCIEHIPESGIVPIDFLQPAEPALEDSCGACVIACGLLEVAHYVSGEEKRVYIETAVRILKCIATTRADWTTDCDAIVQNCSGSYHDKRHHFPMIYADYYFIEALYKLVGKGICMW